MNKNVSHNLEGLIKMEDLDKLSNLIDNTKHKCISRSGIVGIDHTVGNGSNFSAIFLAAFIEAVRVSEGNIFTDKFKKEIVNRFMTY